MHSPRIISLSPLSLATDVTDATLGPSGLWLGTRTGAGGTAALTESFFDCSPWLHGQLNIELILSVSVRELSDELNYIFFNFRILQKSYINN